MCTGNDPQGYLPFISRANSGREPEEVQEKADSGTTNMERRCSTKHNDFLEPKGRFADATSCSRRVSSSSSVETGLNVSELPGLHGVSAHLDLAADLDLRSPSSHSDHSSETPLPEVQRHKYPEEFSLLKLQTEDGQRPEWTFYPRFSSNIHTYHVGKQCFFNGVFLGNRRSVKERTVDKCLGRKKYDINPRNGIPNLTPGDNPYMYPEQSEGFHKAGSTLSPVKFSNLPFWAKEKANRLKNEIREVEELDNWQPATPLLHNLLPPGKHEGGTYTRRHREPNTGDGMWEAGAQPLEPHLLPAPTTFNRL
ncbi:spermatogenesis-associated serine-rich protein 1 isoform X2 [Dasypus novemcinctus]|uniref:spermatogenesis-associated serine-rich protein 1 isoform X2 n=1 Tax=Dasypus novemcinctus TaxID=9361 RepID=UPI00265FB816|nr:spermatogenesis-associated serine-rich protein 1 isoform X2 [Dasypus novemcinctus]